MISWLGKNTVFRFFWVLMTIHILNCSIDSPDPQPDNIPENLAYNDIESIAELVIEQWLGLGNFFAEHDEHDTEDGSHISLGKILFYCQSLHSFILSSYTQSLASPLLPIYYQDMYASQYHPELVSPPPQHS